MDETKQRVVVDGVDFSRMVYFPRMLTAAGSALHPPRLVLALFMVLLVLAVGRVWDGVTKPGVSPAGLMAGEVTEDERQTYDAVCRSALQQYARDGHLPEGDASRWKGLSASDVMKRIEAGYREARAKETGVEASVRASRDEGFVSMMRRVESSRPRGVFEASWDHAARSQARILHSAWSVDLEGVVEGLGELFIQLPVRLWNVDWVFAVVFGLFVLVVSALGGGAISRMAAVHQATGDRMPMREAVDFAVVSWRKLVMAKLLPALVVMVLGLMLAVGGLLLWVPVADIAAGLGYGLALLLGFCVAVVVVGYAAGFSMLVPAVACENCDAAEAMQRSYAYVILRPLHFAGYALLGVIGWAVGMMIVGLVANLTVHFTGELTGTWQNNEAMAVTEHFDVMDMTAMREVVIGPWHSRWTGGLIWFWQTVVGSLVSAYSVAYFFSAATVMYVLLRRACDGQAVDDVWQGSEAAQ